jgi:gliding motility-associated protein GldM
MAGGKETPRQKMVGLMYLVLMALLAMNVSKEVLDSFIKVNDSLTETKLATITRNQSIINGLSSKVAERPDDKIWLKKAQQIQDQAAELVNYLETTKAQVISRTLDLPMDKIIGKLGDYDTSLDMSHLASIDNYDVPTMVLGLSEPASPEEGEYKALTIQKKLEKFSTDMQAMIKSPFKDMDDQIKADIKKTFTFDEVPQADGSMWSWSADNFYHATLAASIVALSNLQVKVLNAQYLSTKYFYDQVGGNEVRVNAIEPVVITRSNYVLKGNNFDARIVVSAYDTNAKPKVYLGDKVVKVSAGKYNIQGAKQELKDGKLSIRGDRAGEFKKEGLIEIKDPSGSVKQYPFEAIYTVAEPTATVSASAMNVFYAGVDNPVEVSAPGFKANDLIVKATGAQISKSNNGYIVRVSDASAKEVKITVEAKMDGGKIAVLSQNIFRIKALPRPVGSINGSSGDIEKSSAFLRAASKIDAEMQDFLFDVKVTVQSFVCTIIAGGRAYKYASTNDQITDPMREAFKQLREGDMVMFKDIKAKLPDGSVRVIIPVSVNIK